ncbi:BUD13 homolog [Macrosteles quadrilineatus]|uniref:BUD13 homolog n=1 Tax=Macrosteles quadrilineatus TaxID=74068 RepID=UPI0023E1C00F|nr:BUD13 homolog [Macrosteles quadrilineatus]
MESSNAIATKEYLKKYLSGEGKKKKVTGTGANIKRSVIVDDDIDLKSMRPLEDDEVELYQMDEDAPQIAGIIDERPAEVKAQEYYSSKRWKVFGEEGDVKVVDNNDRVSKALKAMNDLNNLSGGEKMDTKNRVRMPKSTEKYDVDGSSIHTSGKHKYDKSDSSLDKNRLKKYHTNSDSDESPPRGKTVKNSLQNDDSDVSPPRKHKRHSSSDSDASPPRKKYDKDSDESPPRIVPSQKLSKSSSKYDVRGNKVGRNRSYSNSPPRNNTKKQTYKRDSYISPSRRRRRDSDGSPSRVKDKYRTHNYKYSPVRKDNRSYKQEKSDSDASPPRKSDKHLNVKSKGNRRRPSSNSDNSPPRRERSSKRRPTSDSDNSPPRRERRSPKNQRRRKSRSRSPNEKHRKSYRSISPKHSRTGVITKNNTVEVSDSDDSPVRRKNTSKGSDSDLSPPRKNSSVNDRPIKKKLYKPNDDSSDEGSSKSKNKKMKTTLDGKQAGLQDAKQLKKELSDLKMKEDTMFAKMDASVSGVGAAPVKRDRKTGQIRDLEKEKEAQKEKEAKESVVNEKYYKWGKGIKQTEDAAARAAEMIKEMNKPLARYKDDTDLDEFLKAQDREGDPMLDYIKRKQTESTSLQGEKPIYKGSWNPNRFNIRPGYRWDGVVRSNGYEQEWFKTKNAKKARDEEAYKWSTSDM